MEIRTIGSIDELLEYRADWDSILYETGCTVMFLELEWISSWWELFGDRHELYVLCAVADGEIAGFCPLMVTKRGGFNEIGFVCGRDSVRMDFLIRERYREEAVKEICSRLRTLKGRYVISLHGMPEASPNYALVRRFLENQGISCIFSNLVNYYLDVSTVDYDTHFENRFGKKTRQTMNSKEKKLKCLGKLEYKKIPAAEIDEAFEVHEKRWLRKVGNSSFSRGDTREFYKKMASGQKLRFDTEVAAITLDNKIISFMYGFLYNGRYLFNRIAHDDDYGFLSPGELVFRKKMEECFTSGVDIFDFGPGFEPYKAKWSDDFERICTAVFPSAGLQSYLLYAIRYWARLKVIGILKSSRGIYSFKKYTLGKIKFLFSGANISEKLSVLKREISRNGMLQYLLGGFSRLFSTLYSNKKYTVYVRTIEDTGMEQGSLQIREAAACDADNLSEAMNEPCRKVVRRLASKQKCYAAFYNNRIILYCWVNFSGIRLSGKSIDIPSGGSEAQIYDIYMEREYSGQFSLTRIMSAVFSLLYRENCRRCFVVLADRDRSPRSENLREMMRPYIAVQEKKRLGTATHNTAELKAGADCGKGLDCLQPH